MTRIGGRNVVFAWVVGVLCAAVVGTLALLAVPLLTTAGGLLGGPAAPAEDDATAGPGCRDLYSDPLWASLNYEAGSELSESTDPPVTSASALVEALEPQVQVTCTWTAPRGTISTTVAEVGSDAGSIAAAALPEAGFSCGEADGITSCTRSDGDLLETIEAADGVWVSTSQQAWQPERYAQRVARAARAG